MLMSLKWETISIYALTQYLKQCFTLIWHENSWDELWHFFFCRLQKDGNQRPKQKSLSSGLVSNMVRARWDWVTDTDAGLLRNFYFSIINQTSVSIFSDLRKWFVSPVVWVCRPGCRPAEVSAATQPHVLSECDHRLPSKHLPDGCQN